MESKEKFAQSTQMNRELNDKSQTIIRIRKQEKTIPHFNKQINNSNIQEKKRSLSKLGHNIEKQVQQQKEDQTTNESCIDDMLKSMTKMKLETSKQSSTQFNDNCDSKLGEEEYKKSLSKSRISTAKSMTSSASNQSLLQQSNMSLLFDPNEVIQDNTVIANLVKTNITLLQKCLKSSNKALFISAIENIKNTSNNFGPALNKHLPIVLALVKKKQDLASKERILELKEILIMNGGNEAEEIVNKAKLK